MTLIFSRCSPATAIRPPLATLPQRALAFLVGLPLLLFLVGPGVAAATVTWDGGGGDGNWHNRFNWSGDAVPGAEDDVVVAAAASVQLGLPAGMRSLANFGEVTLRSDSPGNVTLSCSTSITNHGTLWLDSVRGDRTTTLAASGVLLNAPDGVLEVLPGGSGGRALSGDVTNQGLMHVAPGIALGVNNGGRTFTQAGGTIHAEGSLWVTGGRFDLVGGRLLGEVTTASADNFVAATVTTASEFRAYGLGSRLVNLLSPVVTLRFQTDGNSSTTLTTLAGAVNHGRIVLSSSRGDRSATLVADGFVNAPEGVLVSERAGGGPRTITGHCINQGRIEVPADAWLGINGTYEAAGGRIEGNGDLWDVQVKVTASPAEPTTLRLFGNATRLVTDNLPNTILQGIAHVDRNAVLTLAPGVVNHGEIQLDSSRPDRSTTLVVGDVLVNATDGVIAVVPGSGGGRWINGSVINAGMIHVQPGIACGIANASNTFTQAGGSLEAEGALQIDGGRFDFLGGAILGDFTTHNADNFVAPTVTVASTFDAYGQDSRLVNLLSPAVTLRFRTDANSSTTLTTLAGAVNHGRLVLSSSRGDRNATLVAADFVNAPDGVVVSEKAGGGARTITGSFINQGLILVPSDAWLGINGTYEAAGGRIDGNGDLWDVAVKVTASAAAPTTLRLFGNNTRLITDNLPNTILQGFAHVDRNAVITLAPGVANHGELRLDSSRADRTTTLVAGDVLVNATDGVIAVVPGSGGGRGILGAVRNLGTIQVRSGIALRVNNAGSRFTQAGGTIDAEGPLSLEGGRFDFLGGAIRGDFNTYDAENFVAPTATLPSTFAVLGTSSKLVSHLSAAVTLRLQTDIEHHTTLTTLPDAENRGRIVLSSSRSDRNSTLVSVGLVNAFDGTIVSEKGAGGGREITGHLVNQGLVLVPADSGLILRGIYEAAGGRIEGNGDLWNVEVRVTASPAEPTTLRLFGNNTRLTTDNLPNTILRTLASIEAHAVLNLAPGVVNQGVIQLDSLRHDRSTALVVGDVLVNAAEGVLAVVPGFGGERAINGAVLNRGIVQVEPGIGCTVHNEDATFTQAGGTIVADGWLTVSGGRFAFLGGVIQGDFNTLNAENYVAETATTASEFEVFGTGSQLVNHLSPAVTLRLQTSFDHHTALAALPGAVNRGRIALSSTRHDRGSALAAPTGEPFVNGQDGVITVEAGSGGWRSLGGALQNAGRVEVRYPVVIGATGAAHVNRGILRLANSSLTFTGSSLVNENAGRIEGNGTLTVTGVACQNAGTVNPGGSPGGLTWAGNYSQTPSGRLRVELGGLDPETDYDRFTVTGTAALDGTLSVVLYDGWMPISGESYTVLTYGSRTGGFAAMEVPGLLPGLALNPVYLANRLELQTTGQSSQTPPRITVQPAPVGAPPGAVATLSVTATGSDPLAYQWRRNGLEVPGANQASLTLEAAAHADAGDYSVRVSNAAGSVASHAAWLGVDFPVAIGDAISDAVPYPGAGRIEVPGAFDVYTFTANPGQPVYFEVPGNPNGLWWTLQDANGARVFDGGMGSGLVTLALGGPYTLTVSGPNDRTGSYDFKLWHETPRILVQPKSQTVLLGETALLSVTAESRLPMTYQWRFQELDLAQATAATLALANAAPDIAGRYAVVVANSVGAVTSLVATLSVVTNIPDLVVSNLQSAPAGIAGQPIAVWWTTANAGSDQAAAPWEETLLLADNPAGTNALVLGRLTFPHTLPASAALTQTQAVIVPAGLSGAHYFVVETDSDQQIREGLHEGNNLTVAAVPIVLASTDLAVDSVEVQPSAEFGQTVTVQWVVRNAGAAPVPIPWLDRLYLSPSMLSLTEATLLGTVPARSVLAPGASYTNLQAVTIPISAAMAPGVHYLIAVADASDAWPEADEANNQQRAAIALSLPPLPDLSVAAVQAPSTALPGQAVVLTWAVTNAGTASASGPWTEAVALALDANVGAAQPVATFRFNDTLAPGASLVRTQSVVIPAAGPSGRLRFVVQIDTAAELPEASKTNNNASAAQTTSVAAGLTLDLPQTVIAENAAPPSFVGLLTRNSDPAQPLGVSLTSSASARLAVPPLVTLPAGQASVPVTLTVVPDGLPNPDLTVTLTAGATDHAPATASLRILNTDAPALSLALDGAGSLPEGQTLAARLARNGDLTQPLTVAIRSERPAQVLAPARVILAAGQAATTFLLYAPVEGLLEPPRTNLVMASAAGFLDATALVTLPGSDAPTLVFTLGQDTVSEGAGNEATFATLRRSYATPESLAGTLVVNLFSSNPNVAVVPPTATFQPGAAEARFPVRAIDNATVESNRTVDLTAVAYFTGTATPASAPVTRTLTVTDDDGPAVFLSVSRRTLLEGASTTGTVRRNTETQAALFVTLSSSDLSEATVPPSVTIPAGSDTVSFVVSSVNDGITDGTQAVGITASAPGHARSTALLNVTDSDLPDLVVTEVTTPAEAFTGERISVAFRVANLGTAATTSTFKQRVWLSQDPFLGNDTLLGDHAFNETQQAIVPGMSFVQSIPLTLPEAPGDYWLLVSADAENAVGELEEENNFQASAKPIRVGTEYTAWVQTAITLAPAGTEVPLQGQITMTGPQSPEGKPVSIHLTVRGVPRVLRTITQANGSFAASFRPLPGEAGHYTVGAAHPGLNEAPVQDEFTLVGASFVPAALSLTLAESTRQSGTVKLRNLSEVPLAGLTAEAVGVPEHLTVTLDLPTASLAGGGEVDVRYAITANGLLPASAQFVVRVANAVGTLAELPVNAGIIPLRPHLTANPVALIAGAVRGTQRVVQFEVVNDGALASGPLSLLTPQIPWLSVSSPNPSPSLAPGETNLVTLLLTPPADLPLATYQGQLVLSGAPASLSVPFQFRTLSDAKGDLRVTSVDEYTFFAEGAPMLTNAAVVVRDAATQQVLAEGVTDATGLFIAPPLFEGYYEVEVRADQHGAFRTTVLVAAGQTTEVEAFLVRQTVRYLWTVVPTELEDRTRIVVETEFETAVPVPVVTVEPAYVDAADLAPGQTMTVEVKLTNHGLIAAENVLFRPGTHPTCEVRPLVQELGTLPALSSVSIPVQIVRPLAVSRGPGLASPARLHDPSTLSAPCSVPSEVDWSCKCGKTKVEQRTPFVVQVERNCPAPRIPELRAAEPGEGGGALPGEPVVLVVRPTPQTVQDCQCVTKALFNCVVGFIPVFGCVYGLGMGCALDASWENCIVGGIGCIPVFGNPLACAWTFGRCVYPGPLSGGSSLRLAHADSVHIAGQSPAFDPIKLYLQRTLTLNDLVLTILGGNGDDWFAEGQGDQLGLWLSVFRDAVQPASAEGSLISGAEQAALASTPHPDRVAAAAVDRAVNRWNRTLGYWRQGILHTNQVPSGQSLDFISVDLLQKKMRAVDTAIDASRAEGFEDPLHGLAEQLRLRQELIGNSGGICATVRLQIEQDAVLTREGFRASLEIGNGSPDPFRNLKIELAFRTPEGAEAIGLFAVPAPLLEGISAIDGTGVLPGQTTGRATWTLIPGPEAAPTQATDYLVSGRVTYEQGDLAIEMPLAPTAITVHPSPRLVVKYFHQRDVFADDPFTEDFEPSLPYSLAVVVENRGQGTARNFRITSAQPQIVENQKGLLADFQIIAAEADGQPVVPSLTVAFGDIDPGTNRIGRWLLRSSVQGLFTDYKATFEHLDAAVGHRLSLVDSVEIHEMIRLVRAPFGDDRPDFLVNDRPDLLDLPDTIHLSDGSTRPVGVVRIATADGVPTSRRLEIQLDAALPPDGFGYLRTADPQGLDGVLRFRLAGVRRSDGRALAAENFWQTDRTLIGLGQRPVRENLLHLLDVDSTGRYTLIYEPVVPPDRTPPASAVAGMPVRSFSEFPVRWSGTDNTPGALVFDVSVSVDGATFVPWLEGTALTGALYSGQPGHTYAFYSVATDSAGNRETAPALPDAQTTTTLVNHPPHLEAIPDQAVDEEQEWRLTPQASDADGPTDLLTFSLGTGAPGGLTIHPFSGQMRWVPGESAGPSTNRFELIARDNGLPSLGTTQMVTVVVREVNRPPVLAPIPDRKINEGQWLVVTNLASDADLPPQLLTFSLAGNVPPGVKIHATSGVLTWRPTEVQGGTTNRIEVRVTDHGAPALVATQQFNVIVRDVLSDFVVALTSTNVFAGQPRSVRLELRSGIELREVRFRLAVPADRLTDLVLFPSAPEIASSSLQSVGPDLYDLHVAAGAGSGFLGTLALGELGFRAVGDAHSARVPLTVFEVTGVGTDGLDVSNGAAVDGWVIVVAREPVLTLEGRAELRLNCFGLPGARYGLQSSAGLGPAASWSTFRTLRLDAEFETVVGLPAGAPSVFLRAIELP